MIYIIIAVAILVALILYYLKRTNKKSTSNIQLETPDSPEENKNENTLSDVVGLIITFCILLGIVCFYYYGTVSHLDLRETNYVKIEDVYDEPQSYKLEIIPESENKYISYIKDEYASGYIYCFKNQNGDLVLKNTNQDYTVIEFVYSNNVQPSLVIESSRETTILTEKPNIWFNLFKWWRVKDYSVGDIVQERQFNDTYTFYLPESNK